MDKQVIVIEIEPYEHEDERRVEARVANVLARLRDSTVLRPVAGVSKRMTITHNGKVVSEKEWTEWR